MMRRDGIVHRGERDTMSDATRADGVLVPAWLAKVIATCAGAALLGAIAWGTKIASDVSAIHSELVAANQIQSVQLADVKRRLDRIEARLDERPKQAGP